MPDDKVATGIGPPGGRRPDAPHPHETHGPTGGKRFRLTKLWPLALLALGLLALWLAGAGDYLTLAFIIREHALLADLVAQNLFLAGVIYVLVYTVAVAVSFPGASFLTIAGGFLFGAILGCLLTFFAATLGATALFLAARSSLGAFLREKVARFAARFAEGFEENAFSYLFILRLVPLFPFWLINVVPVLFNVRLRTYVLATALGIVPGTLAYTMLGDGLGATIAELEARDPGCSAAGTCKIGLDVLLSPGPLIAMVALSLIAIVPLVVKTLRARQEKPL